MLVVGYGDGGGGATDADLARVGRRLARLDARSSDWFEHDVAPSALPEYRGELYLETHRGTYTTHHDVKSRNAALERALAQAEELAAWCVAVRAPRDGAPIARRRSAQRVAHRAARAVPRRDPRHGDRRGVRRRARRVRPRARDRGARRARRRVSVLPRSDLRSCRRAPSSPVRDDDGVGVRATRTCARASRDDGTIVELGGVDGPNLVAVANGIAAYADRPKRWDAWNLDAGYARKRACACSRPARRSKTARSSCGLRVGKASALDDAHRAARGRAVAARRDRRGLARGPRAAARRAPHRAARARRALRPAARHARAHRVSGDATPSARSSKCRRSAGRTSTTARTAWRCSAPDLYGWNGVGLQGRRRAAGDVAAARAALARPAAPTAASSGWRTRSCRPSGASISALEHAWLTYAEEDRVRLFTCEDPSVLIVATYPADDGSGVIVRVRECDGARAPRRDALRRPHARRRSRSTRSNGRSTRRGRDRRGRPRLRAGPVRAALVPGPLLSRCARSTPCCSTSTTRCTTIPPRTAPPRAAVADGSPREHGIDAAGAGRRVRRARRCAFWSSLTRRAPDAARSTTSASGCGTRRCARSGSTTARWRRAAPTATSRARAERARALARRARRADRAARARLQARPGDERLRRDAPRQDRPARPARADGRVLHRRRGRDGQARSRRFPARVRACWAASRPAPRWSATATTATCSGAHEVGLFTVLIDVHAIPIPAGGPRPDAVVASIADVLGRSPARPAKGSRAGSVNAEPDDTTASVESVFSRAWQLLSRNWIIIVPGVVIGLIVGIISGLLTPHYYTAADYQNDPGLAHGERRRRVHPRRDSRRRRRAGLHRDDGVHRRHGGRRVGARAPRRSPTARPRSSEAPRTS